jgi:hypothetical protein
VVIGFQFSIVNLVRGLCANFDGHERCVSVRSISVA